MTFDTDLIDGFLEDAEGAIARGAMSQAKSLYQGVLAADDSNRIALTQLAALAFTDGDFQTALALYAIALEHYTRDADIHHGLGAVYWKLGDTEKAEAAFETAMRIEPDHEPALFDRARLYQVTGRPGKAERLYLSLASKNLSRVDAIFNRGVIMFRQGNLIAADRWFRQAAKRDPYSPRPVINLALIYRYWGRFEDADRCLNHVVEHHPDLVDAHWNLANLDLLRGNFKDGFSRMEWRFKREGFAPPERNLPRWAGGDVPGGSLLLVAEQGLGDTMQMARYVAQLADRGLSVGIEAQRQLHSVLETVPGVVEVIDPGGSVDQYGAWLQIMSVPAVLGTVEETIPSNIPYISVPKTASSVIRQKDRFRIGFVWRGNPKHETDRLRSIPLSMWSPVFETEGVDFVSLQVGGGESELAEIQKSYDVIDAAPDLNDFGDTAAWVDSLDLIISVDTATAHLAAAMGKPVWLMISPANDWRWMIGREDSPWYPTLRIFRASKIRIWKDVMHQIAQALTERVTAGRDMDQPGRRHE